MTPRDAFRSEHALITRLLELRELLETCSVSAIDYEAWSMARCVCSPVFDRTPLDGFDELVELHALLRQLAERVHAQPGGARRWDAWSEHRLRGVALRDIEGVAHTTAHRWVRAVDDDLWRLMIEDGWAVEDELHAPVRVATQEILP